jgi:hypothetical protein
MSPSQLLRYLILAMWGTAIVGAVLDLSLESTLPEPLRQYLNSEWNEENLTPREWVGVVAGLASLVLMITGSVRLYRLRATGCRPFFTGLALSVLTMLCFEAVIYNPWSAALYEASMVLGGVIVGWLYLADSRLDFTHSAAPRDRPPPIG